MAMIRHLVPVLGAIALVPALNAEDKGPVVTFSGWADNIFSVSDDNTEQVGGPTAKSTQAPSARFTSTASLKANWKIGDKVSGRINAWFDPTDGGTDNTFYLREAFAVWQATETVGLKMGKYIDHIGWISVEPTGLYLVNGSIIGYTDNTYGNDVLGAAALFTPTKSFAAELHVTNGYYTAVDAKNGGTSDNRGNSDMGWGFDLTYTFDEAGSNVNLEGAYDTHSERNAYTSGTYPANDPTTLGGNVAFVGLNLTLKSIKDLTLGFEIQALQAGKGKDAAENDVGGKEKIYQGMILANYALSGTPCPMSVTLSDQYIVAINDEKLDETGAQLAAQGKVRSNAIQAALLTNPTGSSNFGLNLEVGYYQIIDGIDDKVSTRGWETALEALITF